jgi:uncharacterized membrane protein YbjE (DUF340 family)
MTLLGAWTARNDASREGDATGAMKVGWYSLRGELLAASALLGYMGGGR